MGNHFSTVHIITGLTTGGAEIMLYQMLTKTDRERYNPTVISLIDRGTLGDRIEELGIPVYTIGMEPGRIPTPNSIWKLISTVRKIQPDLIQGWMPHGNLAAQLVGIFYSRKIPVLWDIQSSLYSLALEKKLTAIVLQVGAYLSRLTFKIVYVSKVAQAQHEAVGYAKDKSYFIPNGIDVNLFMPSREAKLKFRQELGLPETSFLIGLICRYHPQKDHPNFIKAAALLSKRKPGIHFIMVGDKVDSQNQDLHQLIQELGITNQIHLLGERKDISYVTAALDIACSASAFGEASPLIIAESMSAGVPCVVTDVGDSGLMVGDTGQVVPPKDPEALANAWQELIDLDADDREALGKLARARVIECFSLDSVVANYERLYESAISQRQITDV
jgi:glycosyltransferase involved in cell wall biosynthesis